METPLTGYKYRRVTQEHQTPYTDLVLSTTSSINVCIDISLFFNFTARTDPIYALSPCYPSVLPLVCCFPLPPSPQTLHPPVQALAPLPHSWKKYQRWKPPGTLPGRNSRFPGLRSTIPQTAIHYAHTDTQK